MKTMKAKKNTKIIININKSMKIIKNTPTRHLESINQLQL